MKHLVGSRQEMQIHLEVVDENVTKSHLLSNASDKINLHKGMMHLGTRR